MFRPVPSTLDTARRLGFLEYLIRVTTSEDEAKPYISTFQGNLALKITSLKKKPDEKVLRLEDELTLRDLTAVKDPSISLIMYVLGDEGLLKKVIEPEIGSSWPLMYLFAAGRFLCILYTPELTYLDRYNPLTGEAKFSILSPLLIDSIRPSLYHNKSKNTVFVQTDIVLSDPFEVTEDVEETETPYDLNVAISGFTPLVRKTIGNERNRASDLPRRSEELMSERSVQGREKQGSKEPEEVKSAQPLLFGGIKKWQNTPNSLPQETKKSEQAKPVPSPFSAVLKKSNQQSSSADEKRPKPTEPEQGKSALLQFSTSIKKSNQQNSPPEEMKESEQAKSAPFQLSAYFKKPGQQPSNPSPQTQSSGGLFKIVQAPAHEEVSPIPPRGALRSKTLSKELRVSELEISGLTSKQDIQADFIPAEEVIFSRKRKLTQGTALGQMSMQTPLFEDPTTFSAVAKEAITQHPVKETVGKDEEPVEEGKARVSSVPLKRQDTRFSPGRPQELSCESEDDEDATEKQERKEIAPEKLQVEEEDEELYRPSVKVPSKYRDECRCLVT